MKDKKETSWFVRLPYRKEKGFYENNYTLIEEDIIRLKSKAENEGRTLGRYIAYHLKQLLK